MNTRTLTLCAALAASLVSAPALASERTERVAYADLNLATADGQAELQHRLDAAARKVCRFDASGQVATAEKETACYRATRKTVGVRFAEAVENSQRGG
jgi:UrcA family protein